MMILIDEPTNFAKSVPDIIKAAATSTLGILALILLILGFLAYRFFKNASEGARLRIFYSLLAGFVLFFTIAVVQAAKTDSPRPSPIKSDAAERTTQQSGLPPAQTSTQDSVPPHSKSPDSKEPASAATEKPAYDSIIWGIIVDDQTNQPISHARVITAHTGSFTTSSDGTFELEFKGVKPGSRMLLTFTADGYDAKSLEQATSESAETKLFPLTKSKSHSP